MNTDQDINMTPATSTVRTSEVATQRDELLEACKRSVNWLASYPGGGATAVLEQVNAAIARVEGNAA